MSVNKVQLVNGETIIDISDSTVTPETLAEGVTAHDASGQKITGKMVPGGGKTVQSDWNQNDDNQPDYVKNRPFYTDYEILIEEQSYEHNSEGTYLVPTGIPEIGTNITVIYDNVEYITPIIEYAGSPFFGNQAMLGYGDTGEPFCGVFVPDGSAVMIIDTIPGGSHTIMCFGEKAVKLPEKYVKDNTVVFYINNESDGGYLYTTPECSVKATKTDIASAMNKPVRVNFYGMYIYSPVFIYNNPSDKYAYICILELNREGYVNLYTEEYTP